MGGAGGREGRGDFIQEQIESGLLDGGIARCRATTRKGKPCQRTPLPDATTAPRTSTSRPKPPRSGTSPARTGVSSV